MTFPDPFKFVIAMARSAWAKFAGYDILVTDNEQHARLFWCNPRCIAFDSASRQCKACGGCFVDAKTMLSMEECPRGLWRRVWRLTK